MGLNDAIQRIRIEVRGAVQGVGFRPFIYRLAGELGLAGWVLNDTGGVRIEAEAGRAKLEAFLLRIEKEKPPRAFIHGLESAFLDPAGYTGFEIRESDGGGSAETLVLPDIAACGDCLREISDPADRRYRYPFTNCTHCGPRFTIIESLPYDRSRTTMRKFEMCPDCRREYGDPLDRRFHAQPTACPRCGPSLELWGPEGARLFGGAEALTEAADRIAAGNILAVKGLGGFHLMADARNEKAVRELRVRKKREEKPFALMAPSLQWIRGAAEVSDLEERLLVSPEAPIVLLKRRGDHEIAYSVAPENPNLGIMLPYTPLHHLIMAELGFPFVATSGNLSDEPILTDESETLDRLGGLADFFLVHDRPILRPVDDSIVRIVMGRELVIRRARGFAPFPIRLKVAGDPVLAVGGHLKNTVALRSGRNVFVSQHLGDLQTRESLETFRSEIGRLQDLFRIRPERVICDLHPDYFSTRFAQGLGLPVREIQHHAAHVASCMAENELDGRLLGVSWDGTGYGPDGTVWGGEFLLAEPPEFRRAAALRRFRLPGGGAAVREPRRAAAGVLYEILGERMFDRGDLPTVRSFKTGERTALRTMLEKGVSAPLTSSAGRLFDAVASMIGLCQRSAFEGQAAMKLEWAVGEVRTDDAYPFEIHTGRPAESGGPFGTVDWEATIRSVLDDLRSGRPAGLISARFHNTLAEIIVETARRFDEERVVLTGGCFQNRYLTERSVQRLEEEGFRPYWHQRIPPNDGGIALGQVFAASMIATRPAPEAVGKTEGVLR